MLDMPIRAGRRLQDAAVLLRENLARHTSERQQVNSLHRQRMTCSGSLQFTNTQDWTTGMEMSPSGRFRVIEEAKPKQKLLSREGIRWDAAWLTIAVIILVCTVILLADLAGTDDRSGSADGMQCLIGRMKCDGKRFDHRCLFKSDIVREFIEDMLRDRDIFGKSAIPPIVIA